MSNSASAIVVSVAVANREQVLSLELETEYRDFMLRSNVAWKTSSMSVERQQRTHASRTPSIVGVHSEQYWRGYSRG